MNQQPVYHQTCKLPLYCLKYDVIIAPNITTTIEHLKLLYPGVEIKLAKGSYSYSCTLAHPTLGDNLVFLLATEGYDKGDTVDGAIAHEATNMSWLITDILNLDIEFGKHSTQSFIIGELVQTVKEILIAFEEVDKGLEGL